jgi:hypothetical protein
MQNIFFQYKKKTSNYQAFDVELNDIKDLPSYGFLIHSDPYGGKCEWFPLWISAPNQNVNKMKKMVEEATSNFSATLKEMSNIQWLRRQK